jgi:PHP family Zn ribbon phosphoesterase
MFCPKCGNEMIRQGKELYCPSGDMYLSMYLESRLAKAIESTPFEVVPAARLQPRTLPYFCSRCTHELVQANDSTQQCPECSLTIDRGIIHDLIELHPHKGPDGKWR